MLAAIPTLDRLSDIQHQLEKFNTSFSKQRERLAVTTPKPAWEALQNRQRQYSEYCRQCCLLSEDVRIVSNGWKAHQQIFLPDKVSYSHTYCTAIQNIWTDFVFPELIKDYLNRFTIKLPQEKRAEVLVHSINAVPGFSLSDDDFYDHLFWAAIETAKTFHDIHTKHSPQCPEVPRCAPAVHCLTVHGVIRRAVRELGRGTKESLQNADQLAGKAQNMRQPQHEGMVGKEWRGLLPTIDSWSRQLQNIRMHAKALLRQFDAEKTDIANK